MNALDWAVIVLYAVSLIVVSLYLSRAQHDTEDYFLAGRDVPWWGIGISTMATQLGAVSFISAPAFVALAPGGGLVWLGYEFAVPLAMIFVMAVIVPFLHRTRVVSIYEYLEIRFDSHTRTLISVIFQISRALATGVTVYAVALVLSVTIGMELWLTIMIIGVVAMVYDTLGGMRAVIVTDIFQMAGLVVGIVVCCGFAWYHLGGLEQALQGMPSERFQAIDWGGRGFGDGRTFGFWPLVFGGFFLYVAYYGCDQSQVQRELSARSEDDVKKSLFFNGIVRFPVVVSYCVMGLLIGALLRLESDFAAAVPSESPDYMVPVFIVNYLPHGLIGLLVVAILAAAMSSSLDSALNSLSAATYQDLYQRYLKPDPTESEALRAARMLTIFWGVLCTGFAFIVGTLGGTAIEMINRIGSTFYGPIAATFVLGIMTRTAMARAVNMGILLGVGVNLSLWIFFPQVSWLWWNLIGFVLTFGVGWLMSLPCRVQVEQGEKVIIVAESKSQVTGGPAMLF